MCVSSTFNLKFYTPKHNTSCFAIPLFYAFCITTIRRELRTGEGSDFPNEQLSALHMLICGENDNLINDGLISASRASDPHLCVCARRCVRRQLRGCLPVCGGGRETEMERREERRGRVMMLRGERKGGREVCSEVSERAREEKKEKAAGKGETRRTTATTYRCWRLQQRSAALSGHRKMVSVRGELTVAYNLMFSILDSFSMGNATARNSRAPLPFLLFFFLYLLSCLITLTAHSLPSDALSLSRGRAISSDSQGLVSAGLALGAGPNLPLHQSRRALSAAVMQIDRAACTPSPTPPSWKASRRAKETRKDRKELRIS